MFHTQSRWNPRASDLWFQVMAEIGCALKLWNFRFLCRKRFPPFLSTSLASPSPHLQWKQRKETQLGHCPGAPLKHWVPSKGRVATPSRGASTDVGRKWTATKPPSEGYSTSSACPKAIAFQQEDMASPVLTPNRKSSLTNCPSKNLAKPIWNRKTFFPLKEHFRQHCFLCCIRNVFLLRITSQFSLFPLVWQSIYQMQTTFPPETLETVQIFTLFHYGFISILYNFSAAKGGVKTKIKPSKQCSAFNFPASTRRTHQPYFCYSY